MKLEVLRDLNRENISRLERELQRRKFLNDLIALEGQLRDAPIALPFTSPTGFGRGALRLEWTSRPGGGGREASRSTVELKLTESALRVVLKCAADELVYEISELMGLVDPKKEEVTP